MRFRLLALSLLVPLAAHAQQQTLFQFHTNFWINLHHYLHALTRTAPLNETLPASATAEERQRWNAALAHYGGGFGRRSLLFDDELVGIRQVLGSVGSNESVDRAKLAPELRAVLAGAAPVYRKYYWPAHQAASQLFQAQLQPLLDRHGTAIARRLAASYDATWPSTPIRVDLVHDAGPPGNAYTISDPTLIAIGVSDSRHTGLAALELVFHEASHRWDSLLMNEVKLAATRLQIRAPGALWHGLLFYNAGAITAEELANAGIRNYQMYMFARKTFDNPGWHEAIARHWPAVLRNEVSRVDAIERILRDLQR